MKSAREAPRISTRLWVFTASEHTQARIRRGKFAVGELVVDPGGHGKREGTVATNVLFPVAGVGARQGAERHRSPHEAAIRVRFAG